MKLIADSGSTKTAWCIADKDGCVAQFHTAGINPFYMEPAGIIDELQQLRETLATPVEQIYFYGAGVASPQMSQLLCHCLLEVFPEATAQAHTDLLGAARALCRHEPGMAGILGTGSNSCFYDGKEITDSVPPCGFILGDEGSGAAIGKRLVADYLKRRLPEALHTAFHESTGLTKEDILERVYRQAFPNRFLASLVKFLDAHSHEDYVQELLANSFDQFFTHNIMHYDYKHYPLHLLGSVAFYFQDSLKAAAARRGICIGKIETTALPGLLLFHDH